MRLAQVAVEDAICGALDRPYGRTVAPEAPELRQPRVLRPPPIVVVLERVEVPPQLAIDDSIHGSPLGDGGRPEPVAAGRDGECERFVEREVPRAGHVDVAEERLGRRAGRYRVIVEHDIPEHERSTRGRP